METVVRLIQKKAIKTKDGEFIYDAYNIASFVRIINNKDLYLSDDKQYESIYDLDNYEYIFIEKYILKIDELKEIYNKFNNDNQQINSLNLQNIYKKMPIFDIVYKWHEKRVSDILRDIEIINDSKNNNTQEIKINKENEINNNEEDNKDEK